MSQYTASIQALYVAYFNRPADPSGLAYWETIVAAAHGSTAAVSADFAKQPEYKAAYAGMNSDQIINQVYLNIFGRSVDSVGLEFWSPKLTNKLVTIDQIVTEVAKGAQGLDLETYENRTTASVAYTDALNHDVALRLAYSNAAAIASAKAFLNGITTDASLTTAIEAAALAANLAKMVVDSAPVPPSVATNLTSGIDTFVGTFASDVITGVIDPAVFPATGANNTLNALDSIDGGAGIDTLIINDVTGNGVPTGVTVKNVENVIMRSAGDVNLDTTSWQGVTSAKVTQGDDVDVLVGSGTAVEVSGTTGSIGVDGGSTQTVTTSALGESVDLNNAKGAVSVTFNDMDDGSVRVDGGTTVSIVAKGLNDGYIGVGTNVNDGALPTGAVTVDVTGAASEAGSDHDLGYININGGSTVTVKQTATSSDAAAAEDTTGTTITQADVYISGSAKTTSVTVVQSAEVAEDHAVTIVAAVKEVQVVTFGALLKNESLTLNGLTFTAGKDLTAAQVASAFANLGTTATQGSAAAGNGIYSGAANGNFATGAVVANGTAQTVTFTAAASKGNLADMTVGGIHTAVTSVAAGTDGQAAAGYAGTLGVTAGWVGINGNITGTDVLATVSLDSWGADSGEGNSFVASDALTSLTLANSKHNLDVINTVATSLNLSLNNVGDFDTPAGAAINLGTSTYTTLNIATTGADSRAALTANAVETLAVSGTKAVNLSGSSLTGLKAVTVSGSAGLNVDGSASANLASVDTSATTGTVTAKINAATATYVGGAGTDNVTLSTTTTTKAVALGAGNDSLTLAATTTTLTAVMDGGAGTDTLKMNAADAATASATTAFATKFTGFEKLSLNASVSGVTNTVDLSNMNNINYVISAGSATTVAAAPAVPTAVATQGGITAEATTYSFGTGLAVGQSFTVNGVTVTNNGALAQTAASVASVFGGATVLGLAKTGTFATPATWTGAPVVTVSGSDLIFTNTVIGDVTDFVAVATSVGATVAGTGALVLTKMANAGTLELTGAGSSATVTMADATGTADSFNIVTKVGTSSLNFGTVDVAGVESIALTVTDTAPTTASGAADIQTATLKLTDAALKSIVITGNSALTLTLDASVVALTSVDGSAMTGKLTAGTNGIVSQTILGGAAGDSLTANGNADVLNGGAGADTLILGANGNLTSMTGGAGNDVFNIAAATSNVNSYATIVDATAGDKIVFGSGISFIASKVSLGDTAVFQDLANAAIATTDAGQISWFQFGGNTYAIENITDSTAFLNGTDVIVKIVGAVDLSTASFSASAHSLLFV